MCLNGGNPEEGGLTLLSYNGKDNKYLKNANCFWFFIWGWGGVESNQLAVRMLVGF